MDLWLTFRVTGMRLWSEFRRLSAQGLSGIQRWFCEMVETSDKVFHRPRLLVQIQTKPFKVFAASPISRGSVRVYKYLAKPSEDLENLFNINQTSQTPLFTTLSSGAWWAWSQCRTLLPSSLKTQSALCNNDTYIAWVRQYKILHIEHIHCFG